MSAGKRYHLVRSFEDATCTSDDLLACLGQGQVLRLALDQLHAQVVLELLYLGRKRRLAHETAFGGAPEVAGIGDRHQIAQVFELDVGQSSIHIPYLSE